MRHIIAIACALLAGCAQQGLSPRPQDTSIDQRPDWVRRNSPSTPPAPVVYGLAALLQGWTAQGAAARPATRRGAWQTRCSHRVAEATIICMTIRRVQVGQDREYVGVSVYGREGSVGLPMLVTSNDWPANYRYATVRVDTGEPTRLTDRADQVGLISRMLAGDVVHLSRYGWPRDLPIASTIPLDGFHAALQDLVVQSERAGFRMRPAPR